MASSKGKPARRSGAWLYYAVLSVVTLFLTASTHGISLIFTALFAAYAAYLYRGGRFVIWFW